MTANETQAPPARRGRTVPPARRRPSPLIRGLVLFLVAAAIVHGVRTVHVPHVSTRRTAAATVLLPGGPARLDWPASGQAAVEVLGTPGVLSSGGSTPMPMASVAKVMTAYLVLAEHPLAPGQQGYVITVTRAEAAEQRARAADGQSTLPVRAGERLTERQALEALLLPSANNIAAMLAARSPGGESAFVGRMNLTARGLGMSSTTYTDPSGFQDLTVSTASDQLRIAAAALANPVFAQIVAEPEAVLPYAGTVSNINTLAGTDGYVGVKTGSDGAAGGCLVFARRVAVAGRTLTVLGAVLGQHGGLPVVAAIEAGRRLGDSAAAELEPRLAMAAGSAVLHASGADGSSTSAVTRSAITVVGLPGTRLPVTVVPSAAASTVSRGAVMASVRVAGAQPVDAVASGSIGGPSLLWRIEHLL